MSKTTVGVAILGAGLFAREAYIPAIKAHTEVSLVAIYSRSQKSADALAYLAKGDLSLKDDIPTYFDDPNTPSKDLDALLARSDVNAVIIALPITTQPGVILKSLAAGKHVLSEKPIAPSIKEAIDLIKTYESTYKSKGLHWRVAENFESEPIFHAARRAIVDGKIGDLRGFEIKAISDIQVDNKWYQTPWRTKPDYQGGFLLDGGVHSAAALRTILPPTSQPITLSSYASLTYPYLAPHDTINAIITLASSTPESAPHGIFNLSFASPLKSRNESRTLVSGTTGYLTITSFQVPLLGSHYRLEIHSKVDGKEVTEEIVEKNQGVLRELEHFTKLVSGKGDDGYGEPKAALADVEIIEKGLTSNGNELKLDAASTSF